MSDIKCDNCIRLEAVTKALQETKPICSEHFTHVKNSFQCDCKRLKQINEREIIERERESKEHKEKCKPCQFKDEVKILFDKYVLIVT